MTLLLAEKIRLLRSKETIKPPNLSNTKQIAVIVPVKNNQEGVNTLLKSFFLHTSTEHYPIKIIIVDNNSTIPITVLEEYRTSKLLKVMPCKEPGPAAARNAGAFYAIDHYQVDWLLFMDSDCQFTQSTLEALLCNSEPEYIGYQLKILAGSNDWLSNYYIDDAILSPTFDGDDPEALITAGALIASNAFIKVGGFNTCFTDAAGEDLYLGTLLRTIGFLTYRSSATVVHDFVTEPGKVMPVDCVNFINRFSRYGRGNKILEEMLLKEWDVKVIKSPNTKFIISKEALDAKRKEFLRLPSDIEVEPLSINELRVLANSAMFYSYHSALLFDATTKEQNTLAEAPTDMTAYLYSMALKGTGFVVFAGLAYLAGKYVLPERSGCLARNTMSFFAGCAGARLTSRYLDNTHSKTETLPALGNGS